MRFYNTHIESGGNDSLQRTQIAEILHYEDRAAADEDPVVIGGDFNNGPVLRASMFGRLTAAAFEDARAEWAEGRRRRVSCIRSTGFSSRTRHPPGAGSFKPRQRQTTFRCSSRSPPRRSPRLDSRRADSLRAWTTAGVCSRSVAQGNIAALAVSTTVRIASTTTPGWSTATT